MADTPPADVKSAAGGTAVVDQDAAAAAQKDGLKIPSDLSKVSNAKAKELVEAGVVQDQDVPGKMYKRKADGFVARIPNYTFDAYGKDLQDEWVEVKLTTEAPPDEAPAQKA
jgi:hypothetical protein